MEEDRCGYIHLFQKADLGIKFIPGKAAFPSVAYFDSPNNHDVWEINLILYWEPRMLQLQQLTLAAFFKYYFISFLILQLSI